MLERLADGSGGRARADDLARARHLLALAADLRGPERGVFWTEALALARDGEVLESWAADGSHAILVDRFEPEDLEPGFWAASLCLVPDRGVSLARLPRSVRDQAGGTWGALRQRVRELFASGKLDR